jgi:hypothetical protein
VETEGPAHCINCGTRLDGDARFCGRCGAPRWSPGPPHEEARAGTRPSPSRPVSLGILPWAYAAGAIFLLVWATQILAVFVSPAGRSQVLDQLAHAGYPATYRAPALVAFAVIQMTGLLVAAGLHGAAYYGLRRVRRWGWLAAVVVAAVWSLLLVGIPVLIRLTSKEVRQTFGVA